MLSEEPVTPNEVAKRLGISFKTAKDVLRPDQGDVHCKGSGMIHTCARRTDHLSRAIPKFHRQDREKTRRNKTLRLPQQSMSSRRKRKGILKLGRWKTLLDLKEKEKGKPPQSLRTQEN